MNKQDIQNIRPGAKQIPLLFEKDPARDQGVVLSCVREFAGQYGEVDLHRFLEFVKERHGFNEAHILQLVFWLASDQEIAFSADGKTLTPHEAKKRLLESPDIEIILLFHQPVEDVVLEKVQDLYARITGLTGLPALPDPHDLSRNLAKQLRYWDDCLNACKSGVAKPRFPGKEAMAKARLLIDGISVRRDPSSLIHAFYENGKEIPALSREVQTLYGFYLRHEKTWETLIRATDAFTEDLTLLCDHPDRAKDVEQLREIMASQYPYNRICEATRLVDSIMPFHRRIVEEKTLSYRRKTALRMDHLIAGMEKTKGRNRDSRELRRQALQNLRALARKIPLAADLSAVRLLSGEAEDLYELFMEKIQELS